MPVDDVEQPTMSGPLIGLGPVDDDLIAVEVKAVDLDANLVACIELQCRPFTHG